MSPTTIRQDFAKHTWISYAEASILSGLSKGTLYCLTTAKRIRVCSHGPFRVNHKSLLEYMERA
jgi:hypothetical protein